MHGASPRWRVIVTDAPTDEWLALTADFFNSHFPGVHAPRSTPELFRWKLTAANPAGSGLLALAVHDDEIVGTMTATMKRCVVDGMPRTAAEVGDTYTHPAFRRAGEAAEFATGTAGTHHYLNKSVFGRLVFEVTRRLREHGTELIYGTPNGSSLPGYVNRGGYIELLHCGVRSWHRPTAELATGTILPTFIARSATSGVNVVARLANRPPGAGLTVHEDGATQTEFDDLWAKARLVSGVQLVQDAAYFEHRFLAHPDARYDLHSVRRDCRLVAVVVVRRLQRPNGRWTQAIADWIVDPAERGVLPWAIAGLASRPGATQTVSLWTNGAVLEPRRCRSLGFLRSRAVPVIVAPTPLGDELANRAVRWDLRLAWTDNV